MFLGPCPRLHSLKLAQNYSYCSCYQRILFYVGADIIGLNCFFGPEETLQTIALMKDALEKAGLKSHLMVQPVGYLTPDAGHTGFYSLPELPFGEFPTVRSIFYIFTRLKIHQVDTSNAQDKLSIEKCINI